MGETGIVVAIDEAAGTITVNMKRTSACNGCRVCKIDPDKEMVMVARNLCGALVGDKVEVELQGGSLMRAAAVMYGLPLAGLVLGVYAGGRLFAEELLAFGFGIGVMGLAFLVIRFAEKKRDKSRYVPMAVRIASE